MIVAIGPRWLTDGPAKSTRLHEPDDYVRRELAMALRCGLLIIPILLRGAKMPRTTELPPDLNEIALLQALEVHDAHFSEGITALCGAIRKRFRLPRSAVRRLLLLYRPAGLKASLIWIAYFAAAIFGAAFLIGSIGTRQLHGYWPIPESAAACVLLLAAIALRLLGPRADDRFQRQSLRSPLPG